jgi:hypothetical protein
MMTRRSMLDCTYSEHGIGGLLLDNGVIVVTLFPDAGAKILNLVDKQSGVDLLWQNERVRLARTYPGAAFDDLWCGGWDELFPTDPPCEVDGNAVHDHGDLWIGPWECSVERDDGQEVTLHLRRFSVALPCLMEKWLTLVRGERHLRFRHRLSNLGGSAVPFSWSLHVAHAISPTSRVHLPTSSLSVVPGQAGRFGNGNGPIGWPLHSEEGHGAIDVAAVAAPDSGLTEWLYASEIREGWCAVTDPSRGVGLVVAFDRGVFTTVWLWGVYGGWRGHYVLLTEPSTCPPGGLAQNLSDGTAAWLEPHGVLETSVVATVVDARGESSGDALPSPRNLGAYGREAGLAPTWQG